jgi:hypothetical protein
MVETTAQLETHIQGSREALQSNLKELEHKVKSVTDWRQHFQNHPGLLLGAAVGGGRLLSMMVGKKSPSLSASARSLGAPDVIPSKFAKAEGRAHESFNQIKGALISLGATQVKDFIGKLLPGFEQHLSQAERDNARENGRGVDTSANTPVPH